MDSETPTLRWGIIATGLVSSWFVRDLCLPRPDAPARHTIQAIGSSSQAKARSFAAAHCPDASPTLYGSYADLYADPAVDAVYIGTPHALHARNCLDAIAAGKHVLCEKAFALTAASARAVFAAARDRGVFVMEALWTRFFPLTRALRAAVHEQRAIGRVRRVFCDFGLDMGLAGLATHSRLRDPALGAGSLLDLGVYALTWGLLAAEPGVGESAQGPAVVAAQSLSEGIDVASSVILSYPDGTQAIATSSACFKTAPEFCRIEGTEGHIVVSGPGASSPARFVVHRNARGEEPAAEEPREFEKQGMGFYWEADAVALDVAAGRTENAVMPWAETIRVLEILDEVRRQGGARFPQDDEMGVAAR